MSRQATGSERLEFVRKLMKEFPGVKDVDKIAYRLMEIGANYGRLQEGKCNRMMSDGEREREARIEREVGDICAKLNSGVCVEYSRDGLGTADWELMESGRGSEVLGRCFAVMGGDPRGCTVKIHVPTGEYDDWGREGLCVPGA